MTQLITRFIPHNTVFFDLETTGVNMQKDRIVQISCIKITREGELIKKTKLVNPCVPIPKEATEIHGITDEMVADAPRFEAIAKSFHDFIKDCNLAGYNSNRFDIPLIVKEFERAGIEFTIDLEKYKIIDVFKIFTHFAPRNLAACYKFYTGNELDGGHDSENDTMATIYIFDKMLLAHPEILEPNTDFFKFNTVDLSGFIAIDTNGSKVFNFGKHKGLKLKDQKDYCNWMLSGDFPNETKEIIRKEVAS